MIWTPHLGIADLGERVDLHQRRVVVLEALPHAQQDVGGLIQVGVVEADLASHALGGLHVEIAEGVDVQTLDRFRMFLGDLLDFGAAVRGGEDIEVPRCAVHGYRHVVLVQDVLSPRRRAHR